MEEHISISGIIEDMIYYNDTNGYSVVEVDAEGEPVVCVGYMAPLSAGETVTFRGKWVVHHEYGRQFKFTDYSVSMPSEEEEILRYLASGIVWGVGEATAKKIVAHFGKDTFKIMLTDPKRLADVKGISEKKAEKICTSFRDVQMTQSIVIYLQKYNISASVAVKVYNALGGEALKYIEDNPYILADRVDGISFNTADAIALSKGVEHNSPNRIKSALVYILKGSAYTMGNTCMKKTELTDKCAKALGIEITDVENVYADLVITADVMMDTVDGESVVYLSSLYNAECYVAEKLYDMAVSKPKEIMTAAQVEEYISAWEDETKIILCDEQKDAVAQSAMHGVMVLTGGPGTGKTTTINTIIAIFTSVGLKVAIAAPTGRAAKRLCEVTGKEAKTIHRLLGATGGGEVSHFTKDENDPLTADVIILDEVSMVDITLMHHFLRAVKSGARLILSGDADQLPSVGAGNVLFDLIKSDVVPKVGLEKIFRQAEQSKIVVNAHRINHGLMPIVNEPTGDFFYLAANGAEDAAQCVTDLYKKRLPEAYGYIPLCDIQILTPTKKGPAGTINLNRLIQAAINPKSDIKSEYVYGNTVFRIGDKVMQTKNNYDIVYTRPGNDNGTGVFNGDMGIITDISTVDRVMMIDFDDERTVEYPFEQLDELELAYAVTVHKSQGSEFPVVIMPTVPVAPMLMCRNLFYTAITRAKQMVVLVGDAKSISNMTSNEMFYRRSTGLEFRLRRLKNNEGCC